MLVGYASIAAIAGLFVLATVSCFANARFFARLKKHHQDLWRSMGSPSPITRSRSLDGAPIMRYLRLRKYRALSDPETVRLAHSARLVNGIFLVYIYFAFVVLVALVLYEKYVP
jgi:hypothetical protein